MKIDAKQLPNDIEQLKYLIIETNGKINYWQQKYESLLEQFKSLRVIFPEALLRVEW